MLTAALSNSSKYVFANQPSTPEVYSTSTDNDISGACGLNDKSYFKAALAVFSSFFSAPQLAYPQKINKKNKPQAPLRIISMNTIGSTYMYELSFDMKILGEAEGLSKSTYIR